MTASRPDPGPAPGLPLLEREQEVGAFARLLGADGSGLVVVECCMLALGMVPSPAGEVAVLSELGAIDATVAPNRVGDYPNFVEEEADVSSFFDPGTWERLRRVKGLYDPDDLFKAGHHIPPAGRG